MKAKLCSFFALFLAFWALSTPMWAQAAKTRTDPCASAATQAELTSCAARDLAKSEAKLKKLLGSLGIAADSPEQRAWEAYRDAQLAAIYPPTDISAYGSVYPMCLAILKKRLTDGRIRDLRALTNSGEGDVCYGYQVKGFKSE